MYHFIQGIVSFSEPGSPTRTGKSKFHGKFNVPCIDKRQFVASTYSVTINEMTDKLGYGCIYYKYCWFPEARLL
jgi:hypothetical protein